MIITLQWLSSNSTQIIVVLAVVHLVAFMWLRYERRKRLHAMAEQLREILNETGVGTSSIGELSQDDLIDSYCQDLLGLLKERDAQKIEKLRQQLAVFDRIKPYKRTHRIETGYNIARTAIEAYPLLGILGTVIALAVSIQSADLPMTPARDPVSVHSDSVGTASPSDVQRGMTSNNDVTKRTQKIIEAFGSAIWSTLVGLLCGVLFMLYNAFCELGFERLADHRRSIADVMMWANKVLIRGQSNENT